MADGAGSCYRVAVASSDGAFVDRHFGKAEKFFIFSVDDGDGYELCEERAVTPVCLGSGHVRAEMERGVRRLSDCRYVVASRIGPAASQELAAQGISCMELPGPVEEALVKIWKYNRVQGLFG